MESIAEDSPMYMRIMDLPLFKGLSRTLVSNLLETVPLEFTNYGEGEYILQCDQSISQLSFVIQGQIEMRHPLCNGKLILSETRGPSSLILADRLCGLNITAPCNVISKDCVIMKIDKDQYLKLLRSNSIYLLNYINYLSMRAQINAETACNTAYPSLPTYLSRWIRTLTIRNAYSIELTNKDGLGYLPDDIAAYLKCNLADMEQDMQSMIKHNLISYNDNIISILDRNKFLDHVAEKYSDM